MIGDESENESAPPHTGTRTYGNSKLHSKRRDVLESAGCAVGPLALRGAIRYKDMVHVQLASCCVSLYPDRMEIYLFVKMSGYICVGDWVRGSNEQSKAGAR